MLTCIISSGALVSHAFELEFEVQALFYGAPAITTFRIPTKAALQVWHSSHFICIYRKMCTHVFIRLM